MNLAEAGSLSRLFYNQLSKSRLCAAEFDDFLWQNAAGALGHPMCGSAGDLLAKSQKLSYGNGHGIP
jgi:hypothetical protein